MLPLTTINNQGNVNELAKLSEWFRKLRQEGNVDGVMVDVWWGIVEKKSNKL